MVREMCLGIFWIMLCLKYHDQKQFQKESGYLAYMSRPVSTEGCLKLGKNMKAGADAESMEECWLPASFSWFS